VNAQTGVALLLALLAAIPTHARPDGLPPHLLGRWADRHNRVLLTPTVVVVTAGSTHFSWVETYRVLSPRDVGEKPGVWSYVELANSKGTQVVCALRALDGTLDTQAHPWGDVCPIPSGTLQWFGHPRPSWWEEAEGAVDRLMERPEFVAELLKAAVTLGVTSPRLRDWHTRKNFQDLELNLLLSEPAGERRLAMRFDGRGGFQAAFLPADAPMPPGTLSSLENRGVTVEQAAAMGRHLLPWIQYELDRPPAGQVQSPAASKD
jgi:hypothetical protein